MLPIFRLPVLVICALLTGCGEPDNTAIAPTPVRVVVCCEGRAVPMTLSGTLVPLVGSQLAFRVSGRVVERLIDAGEIVTQGQALRELNARGQKCYSSIELLPNFAGTGEAYLMGLAITDSPASIGTEKL